MNSNKDTPKMADSISGEELYYIGEEDIALLYREANINMNPAIQQSQDSKINDLKYVLSILEINVSKIEFLKENNSNIAITTQNFSELVSLLQVLRRTEPPISNKASEPNDPITTTLTPSMLEALLAESNQNPSEDGFIDKNTLQQILATSNIQIQKMQDVTNQSHNITLSKKNLDALNSLINRYEDKKTAKEKEKQQQQEAKAQTEIDPKNLRTDQAEDVYTAAQQKSGVNFKQYFLSDEKEFLDTEKPTFEQAFKSALGVLEIEFNDVKCTRKNKYTVFMRADEYKKINTIEDKLQEEINLKETATSQSSTTTTQTTSSTSTEKIFSEKEIEYICDQATDNTMDLDYYSTFRIHNNSRPQGLNSELFLFSEALKHAGFGFKDIISDVRFNNNKEYKLAVIIKPGKDQAFDAILNEIVQEQEKISQERNNRLKNPFSNKVENNNTNNTKRLYTTKKEYLFKACQINLDSKDNLSEEQIKETIKIALSNLKISIDVNDIIIKKDSCHYPKGFVTLYQLKLYKKDFEALKKELWRIQTQEFQKNAQGIPESRITYYMPSTGINIINLSRHEPEENEGIQQEAKAQAKIELQKLSPAASPASEPPKEDVLSTPPPAQKINLLIDRVQAGTKKALVESLKKGIKHNERISRQDILEFFAELKKRDGKYKLMHNKSIFAYIPLLFKRRANNEEWFWHTSSYQEAVKLLKKAYVGKKPIDFSLLNLNEEEVSKLDEQTKQQYNKLKELKTAEDNFIDYVRGNAPAHHEKTSMRQAFKPKSK